MKRRPPAMRMREVSAKMLPEANSQHDEKWKGWSRGNSLLAIVVLVAMSAGLPQGRKVGLAAAGECSLSDS